MSMFPMKVSSWRGGTAEDEAKRAAMEGDWPAVARFLARNGHADKMRRPVHINAESEPVVVTIGEGEEKEVVRVVRGSSWNGWVTL